jgi:UDP-3-O-[3-hydroxymyristoyl] glucosamine N-acyltransferase LpxD
LNINIRRILDYLTSVNITYDFVGNDQVTIQHYSSLKNIKDKSITWVKNVDNFDISSLNNNSDLLVVSNNINDIGPLSGKVSFIFCDNSKEVFFTIVKQFYIEYEYKKYISPNSIIECELLGENIYIGHNCYIGKEVVIHDNVVIKHNVTIEGKVIIGKKSIIHSGVVIGTDGYGYFKNSEGIDSKVPHSGGVIIGEEVEIGANTCIDRGTMDNTFIGNHVKIDNLCHIAHNVIIEENCNLVAHSIICGSVVVKKNSYIAPGAIIKNQLTIGENSLIGLGAVVVRDVEDNKVVAGNPAKVIR